MASGDPRLGPNSWLVEEMFERWQASPDSVDASWRDLFAGGDVEDLTSELPAQNGVSGEPPPTPAAIAAPVEAAPLPLSQPARAVEPVDAPSAPAEEPGQPIRGAGARIVENMELSLSVPTATSYRQVPAKLLEVNRRIINSHLARTLRGKVSFTHLIAYAIVRALDEVPAMSSTFAEASDGTPRVIHHDEVGLGIAVDVEKRDGSRSLLVPCIRGANLLPFQEFIDSYEGLISKVRNNKITVDDFAGTTMSLTNVGTIGTVQSVPRLMPGQAAIVGLGAIDYPAEFQGADPRKLAELGVSKVVTISNTYDHRIIQGAESGLFLQRVHQLLLGEHGFYDRIFDSLAVPHEPVRWLIDQNRSPSGDAGDHPFAHKQMQVRKLIQMHRVRGHLIADLDPLQLGDIAMHSELDPATYGLTVWDLDREFLTDDVPGPDMMALGDILGVLREAYCQTVGVEFMHIQDTDERQWILERFEVATERPDDEERRHILERLSAAEAFERFLHQRYVGHKRFGVEGGESTIPLLDAVFEAAADADMTGIVMGMAHRGRLNVLHNLIGQSYDKLFGQFEGHLAEDTIQGNGDVKYHVGAETVFESRKGNRIPVALAANPSHLEAVDPVVIGMVRATQDVTDPPGSFRELPVLVHGDAAFAGQGVVAETLNLSKIPGYRVGGTVHVIINNQVGYTTPASQARSSTYCTDVSKMVQAPVFHVNGDDPEACVRVAKLAFDFRQRFHKDVVIDIVCYRRHGHNEGDDPSYTQPIMYERIERKRGVRELYTEALVRRGDISPEEAATELTEFEAWLQAILDQTRANAPSNDIMSVPPAPYVESFEPSPTAVDRSRLDHIVDQLDARPVGFSTHPKLARQFVTRRKMYDGGEVDWGLAETLAYGTILMDRHTVRVAGQDTRRGTFAHRHAVIVDSHTEAEHFPLRTLSEDQGNFFVYDSMLSEYAAMGVEYGYSVVNREALVVWEAQFGDFVNGAQIIIDQFLAAGADKWNQDCGLVLLLPHGFEGQGPEHSSARIERFLTLCAEGNMTVANATTSAQFFHLLRRQVAQGNRRPLVVFSPKSLLRSKLARSPIEELTTGAFREILDDPRAASNDMDAATVTQLVLCSGKVAYDADQWRAEGPSPEASAVVRIEQLYPWPDVPLEAILERYPNVTQVTWLQEEPANMGGWSYARSRVEAQLPEGVKLRLVGRPESGSPACGSQKVHQQETQQLAAELFG
jgi:multifunctional 2-oxoglutarate metabolism enzyme